MNATLDRLVREHPEWEAQRRADRILERLFPVYGLGHRSPYPSAELIERRWRVMDENKQAYLARAALRPSLITRIVEKINARKS